MRTHLEVQQREDIRRDLAERMKFVPPDLRAGENVFCWQEDPSKIQQGRKSGKWLKVEIIAIKGGLEGINTGFACFQSKKLRRPLNTVDLEELRDSSERTGALFVWLSCEGQADVWEMCSGNSHLSAILDRQGLLVAAPVDLRRKQADKFYTRANAGLLVQAKETESQDRCDVSDCCNEELQATSTISAWPWQNTNPWRRTLPDFGTRNRKDLVVEEGTISAERVPLPMDLPAWRKTQSGFFTILAICYDRHNQSQSRVSEWFLHSGKFGPYLETENPRQR